MAEGQALGSGRVPGTDGRGLQEARGGGLAWHQVALGVAASGGTPPACLWGLSLRHWDGNPDQTRGPMPRRC